MNIRSLLLAGLLPLSADAGLLALWKLDSSPADELENFPATWGGTEAYSSTAFAPLSAAAAELSGAQWLNGGSNLVFERNTAFSASVWIKGQVQDSTIVGDMDSATGNKGWELHVGSTLYGAPGNSLTVWLNNDYPAYALQVNASVNVLDGNWHHVAFAYDGSSSAFGVRIYVDGQKAPSFISLNNLGADIASNGTSRFNIGSRSQGAACNFTGAIDEVAVFNHALSDAEVAAIRQSGAECISEPFLADTLPLPRQDVATLNTAEVLFSYPVTGVGAWDLLVNGIRTTSVTALDSKRYRFQFETPAQGDVNFSWAPDHGIKGTNGLAAQPSDWTVRLVPVLPPARVLISEFLTRNVGGLEDEDHDTPDWIELHNPGSADVDLAGWALTNDPARPKGWKLPSAILRPGEYRTVFASGKDRSNAAGNLHTDFKLSQTGGYLALSDPAGAVFHAYDGYPRQEGNVSFGLAGTAPSDGRVRWRYFPPTPGTENSPSPYSAASIGQTGFSPALPSPGDPITVVLRMTPEAVFTTSPALYYKISTQAERKLDFYDDGLHGDGAAGDSLWGAVIPGTAITAGKLVRWRIEATSSTAVFSYWPILKPVFSASTPLPNYEGTVVSGGATSTSLPVYQLFGDATPSADTKTGGRYAFFANGKLYDNVFVRIKGTTSSFLDKVSNRIDFNPGREFEWSDDLPPQRELNLNSEYLDPSYLRQNMQLWMHRDSGNSGAEHFPVKLTLNGANWKLAFHTYSADSELLETMGLDPKGALYKQVWTLSNNQGEKKTRRWENYSDLQQFVAGISASAPATSRSRYLHDNLHLPAVINYLAVARIAQEGDDVWANMTVYRDSEGTKEWRIIPFDVNLSFGQLFYGDSPSTNGGVQATNDNNKSHPLYGSSACCPSYRSTTYNRLYDAIIQTPATRAMLLRRIRTLMDRYLATNAASSPLEARCDAMGAQISAEGVIDRSRWGWPVGEFPYGFGGNITPAQGLAAIKTSFLAPRRTHLYTTHSIQNTAKPIGIGNNDNAGIPDTQVSAPNIRFGTIESQPVSGNADEEFIELVNPGPDAVDMSDWKLSGVTGGFTFEAGTVVPAGNSIFVSPNVVAFRARTVSPKANENRHVVGPFSGHLSAYGDSLRLETQTGTLITQIQVPADPQAPAITLMITEIMSSSNHGDSSANGDWWELTNHAVYPVDLTGFSWDDNRNLPFQAVFPPCMIGPGESLIVLDEDDATAFRTVWNLPQSLKVLTRADFGLSGFRGLGTTDAVILYQPNGTEVVRAEYPYHAAGRSRAWLRSGAPVPGGFSEAGLDSARASMAAPYDLGSPGTASGDPSVLVTPYGAWTSVHDLWAGSALPDADPDGDGRTNRAEFIFGGSPRAKDSPPAALMRSSGGGFEWTFMRRGDEPTLLIELESSTNLKSWTPIALPVLRTTPHPGQPEYEDVTYAVGPSGAKRFFRAKAN